MILGNQYYVYVLKSFYVFKIADVRNVSLVNKFKFFCHFPFFPPCR